MAKMTEEEWQRHIACMLEGCTLDGLKEAVEILHSNGYYASYEKEIWERCHNSLGALVVLSAKGRGLYKDSRR